MVPQILDIWRREITKVLGFPNSSYSRKLGNLFGIRFPNSKVKGKELFGKAG